MPVQVRQVGKISHTHTEYLAHNYTCTYRSTLTHSHAHTLVYAQTHTHTHIHTHTHTHTHMI